MGAWKIEIDGHGCHHNKGRKDDAERIAAEAVMRLKAAGHDVSRAKFTLVGSEDDLAEPFAYLAAKEAADAKP